jgi:hypothetical protein
MSCEARACHFGLRLTTVTLRIALDSRKASDAFIVVRFSVTPTDRPCDHGARHATGRNRRSFAVTGRVSWRGVRSGGSASAIGGLLDADNFRQAGIRIGHTVTSTDGRHCPRARQIRIGVASASGNIGRLDRRISHNAGTVLRLFNSSSIRHARVAIRFPVTPTDRGVDGGADQCRVWGLTAGVGTTARTWSEEPDPCDCGQALVAIGLAITPTHGNILSGAHGIHRRASAFAGR